VIVHPCPRRPWEVASAPADANQRLPDFNDLADDPQLASLAVLQVAARVAGESLLAHHGVGRRLVDEVSEDPDCVVAVLAHVIVERCNDISELIAAYLLASRRAATDDRADFPF
jgi:hypothetical protein